MYPSFSCFFNIFCEKKNVFFTSCETFNTMNSKHGKWNFFFGNIGELRGRKHLQSFHHLICSQKFLNSFFLIPLSSDELVDFFLKALRQIVPRIDITLCFSFPACNEAPKKNTFFNDFLFFSNKVSYTIVNQKYIGWWDE